MTTTPSPGVLRALLLSSHPVPSVVVATLTSLFAWTLNLQWWQVVVIFLAMLTNQLGIGLGNDWLDATRDQRAQRADKPLAVGAVSVDLARIVAVGFGLTALALSAILGPWPVVCQAAMLFAGWWYNVHAKSHWSSPVSYLLGFGLLPIFPSLALTPPTLPVWWVVAGAGLLGVGAHFANALPDLHGDAESDIRGMPQRIGAQASGLVVATTVASATLIVTAEGTSLPVWLRVATALLATSAASVAAVLAFRSVPPRIIFPLVMLSATICTVAMVTQFALS